MKKKNHVLMSAFVLSLSVVCFGDSITGIYYHSGNRRAWPEMLKIALDQWFDGQIG